MAKTKETVDLERKIYFATKKMGTFGCHEVTIGWYGKERVDYLTYDTKGNWRCYEIKVSKSDFHSKANNTFVGNYNYYVMPESLYKQIKNEIPSHIGVHDGYCVIKQPKKVSLGIDESILFQSMVRSLTRAYHRRMKLGHPDSLEMVERMVEQSRELRDEARKVSNDNYFMKEFIRSKNLLSEYTDYEKKYEFY